MPNAKNDVLVDKLNNLLEMELSGVIRYLHYALMVRGPNRIPIVKFFQDQATESLDHAHQVGNKIASLGGHPSLKVKPVPEGKTHATLEILKESLVHERAAVTAYTELLSHCDDNIALEEMVREFVRLEQEHVEEVEKMLEGGR